MKFTKKPLFYLFLVLFLVAGFLAYDIAQAQFVEPGSLFPDGNPYPPLDASTVPQTKNGALNVGSLGFVGSGLCVEDTPGGPMTCRRYGIHFGWYANGSNIYNVNSGNVGIGTQDPAYTLDVSGDLNVVGDIYQDGALFVSGGGDSNWIFSGNNLYASSTDWNVGIGVTNPTNKLSVLGSIGLLRDPSSAVTAGPGPELYFESPSSEVSGQRDEWQPCGGSGQPNCPSDDTPESDPDNLYNCESSDGGQVYTDVADGIQRTFSTLTCVADTAVYSLRTSDGTFEFLDNNGQLRAALGQNGRFNVGPDRFIVNSAGNVLIGTTVDSGYKLQVEGNANISGWLGSTAGGAYGSGGLRVGYHTLNSSSTGWFYLGDENGNIYGGRGLAVGNLGVNGNAYFNGSLNIGLGVAINVRGYIYNSAGNLILDDDVDVNGVISATGGNSTNWNTAYGWGDHAAAGYLTSAGTDADTIVTGGDLSGDQTNATVVGIQDRPVSATAPSNGQVLKWNGSAWAPADESGGGASGPRIAESVAWSPWVSGPGGGATQSNWACSVTVSADLCVLNRCNIRKNDDDGGDCYVSRAAGSTSREWRACAVAWNDSDTLVRSSMRCMNFSTPGTPTLPASGSGSTSGGGSGDPSSQD